MLSAFSGFAIFILNVVGECASPNLCSHLLITIYDLMSYDVIVTQKIKLIHIQYEHVGVLPYEGTVRLESRCALIKSGGLIFHDPPVSILAPLLTLYGEKLSFSQTALCAVASPISFSCANLRNDFYGLRSIESEMSINFLSLSLDGFPLRSASNTEPVSRNFSISLRT
jgi:hypothetical protein